MRGKLVLMMVVLMAGSNIALVRAAEEQLRDMQKQLNQQREMLRQMEQKLGILEQKAREKEELEEDLAATQYQYLELVREKVRVNMYGTLEFEDFRNTDSVFDARNIEVLLDVRAHQRFHIFGEIEFERTAKTSEGDRQGEVEVEQGWVEYGINRYINPRLGVILVPFGRFNMEHFDTYQDLTDRPIMARRVVPITWAEAGAGFAGSVSPGELSSGKWLQDVELNYELYAINGLTNDFSDTSSRDARGAFSSDNNNNKALVGRMQICFMSLLELGLSGYLGRYDDRGNKIRGYDVDWKIVSGPVELVGEFANFDLDGGLRGDGLSITENLQGGYVEGRYHFWFSFLNQTFLGRDLEAPTFTAVARVGYAEIGDDGDAGGGDNREERLALGLNYRPIESLVFKLEYQFNNKDNESLEHGDNDGFIASVSAAF
jgi:hypothetical protein